MTDTTEGRSLTVDPIQGDGLIFGRFIAMRTESTHASTFRMARYPDGRLAMQGGYTWTEGFKVGIAWRDLPTVNVDENGQEIEEIE